MTCRAYTRRFSFNGKVKRRMRFSELIISTTARRRFAPSIPRAHSATLLAPHDHPPFAYAPTFPLRRPLLSRPLLVFSHISFCSNDIQAR